MNDNTNGSNNTNDNNTTQEVKLKVSGQISGEVKVPVGTTVRAALKKIREDVATLGLALRDAAGKVVSLDRNVRTDLTITATRNASGG
jgi:hypothetical protein